MSVILFFTGFVVIGDAVAIAISAAVERFSRSASLMVFFALFTVVFWISWQLAVRVAERLQPNTK